MPVVVNSVYSANNVNAGKIAGSEPRSVEDAGRWYFVAFWWCRCGAGNEFWGKVATLLSIQRRPIAADFVFADDAIGRV